MEFVKGYNVDEEFIAEGEIVKVVTVLGEVIVGKLQSPAKKKFLLRIQEVVRQLQVDEVETIELYNGEDEE